MKIHSNINQYSTVFNNNNYLALNLNQRKVVVAVIGIFALLAIAFTAYCLKCFKKVQSNDTKTTQGGEAALAHNVAKQVLDKAGTESSQKNQQTNVVAQPEKNEGTPAGLEGEKATIQNLDTIPETPQIANQNQAAIVQPTPLSSIQANDSKLIPISQRIIDNFSTQMIEALGGIDTVVRRFKLENWSGDIREIYEHMSEDGDFVVACRAGDNKFFLALPFYLDGEGLTQHLELLERTENGWKFVATDSGQFSHFLLGSTTTILDGPPEEKYVMDRIRRHCWDAKGVGEMSSFELNPNAKPEDSTTVLRPTDAFLEDEQLDEYMKLGFSHYERKWPCPLIQFGF